MLSAFHPPFPQPSTNTHHVQPHAQPHARERPLPRQPGHDLALKFPSRPNAVCRPQPKVADCSAIERLDRGAVRDVRAVHACLEV